MLLIKCSQFQVSVHIHQQVFIFLNFFSSWNLQDLTLPKFCLRLFFLFVKKCYQMNMDTYFAIGDLFSIVDFLYLEFNLVVEKVT